MHKPITKINLSVRNGKGKVITVGSIANIMLDLSGIKTRGGAGSNGIPKLAFVKEDSPDSDSITCYLDTAVDEWLSATTYGLNVWCEVSGTEYKSLQVNNNNHLVSDGDWWEEGTISVTVRCLILNGTSLKYASPFLSDGDEILVHIVGSEYISSGFNGARFG